MSHYRNLWRPSWRAHIYITSPQWRKHRTRRHVTSTITSCCSNGNYQLPTIWRQLTCLFGKNDYEEQLMNISSSRYGIGNGTIKQALEHDFVQMLPFYLEFIKKLSNRCIYQGLWLLWYGFSAHLLVCYITCLWWSLYFVVFSSDTQDVQRKLFKTFLIPL